MISEGLVLSGHVVVKKVYNDGRIEVVEKKNLIVTTGKTVVAKLLGGDASYKNLEHIGKIAFGTGATAAAAGDTALVAQQLAKAVTVSYPGPTQVMFSAEMAENEGGTLTYQELGLLTETTDILFSRLVIAAIVKSTAYKITVDWTISVQVAA